MSPKITAPHQRPILLLRGLLREKRHWGRFGEMLRASFPQREIIALNIAGNGSRYLEQSPTSVSEMVDDLKSQLESYLPPSDSGAQASFGDQGVDIIAISMGGMIALEWMRKYPDDVHSSILINSSLSNYSPFYRRLKWQQYFNILRFFFVSEHKRELLIFEMTTRQSPRSIIQRWTDWHKANPVSVTNALRQLYAASCYKFDAAPNATTLLIACQNDALVDISCSKALAKQWHLPMMVHPESGHDLPSDDPKWLLEKVTMFYQRQNS